MSSKYTKTLPLEHQALVVDLKNKIKLGIKPSIIKENEKTQNINKVNSNNCTIKVQLQEINEDNANRCTTDVQHQEENDNYYEVYLESGKTQTQEMNNNSTQFKKRNCDDNKQLSNKKHRSEYLISYSEKSKNAMIAELERLKDFREKTKGINNEGEYRLIFILLYHNINL